MAYRTLENIIRSVVGGKTSKSEYTSLEHSIRNVMEKKHEEKPGALENQEDDEQEKTKDFDNEAARMNIRRNIKAQQKLKIIDNT